VTRAAGIVARASDRRLLVFATLASLLAWWTAAVQAKKAGKEVENSMRAHPICLVKKRSG
jgi:hypothetical protein